MCLRHACTYEEVINSCGVRRNQWLGAPYLCSETLHGKTYGRYFSAKPTLAFLFTPFRCAQHSKGAVLTFHRITLRVFQTLGVPENMLERTRNRLTPAPSFPLHLRKKTVFLRQNRAFQHRCCGGSVLVSSRTKFPVAPRISCCVVQ